jgi:hypothetical protein
MYIIPEHLFCVKGQFSQEVALMAVLSRGDRRAVGSEDDQACPSRSTSAGVAQAPALVRKKEEKLRT